MASEAATELAAKILDDVMWLRGPTGKKLVGSDRWGVEMQMSTLIDEAVADLLRVAHFTDRDHLGFADEWEKATDRWTPEASDDDR